MNNPFGGSVFGQMWEAVNDHVEERADDALKIMKGVIHRDSGALSDAVEKEKVSEGNFLVGINENKLVNDPRNVEGTNYVTYYYYGTKAHTIRAKKGKMLKFIKNGQTFYRKSVRHPGTEPHNFIQDTLDKMR